MLPQDQGTASLPVSAREIADLLASAQALGRREGLSLLRSLSPRRGLSLHEAARLIRTDNPAVWEAAADAARAMKEAVFGRRVVLFAPLYLSNACGNNCLYCGFRRDNREARRLTLSPDQAAAEARFLTGKGFRRLILVAGEHPTRTRPGYIAEVLRTVYRETDLRILHVNAAPMEEDDLRMLKEAGAGVYQVFQETYHPETYAALHPSGPKADYGRRLACMDTAVRAGFDDVGIGALLGLYDWRFEVLAVVRHATHLFEAHGTFPHTISVPRFKRAFGAPLDRAPAPVTDAQFERIVILYRLAVPPAGIVVTTREPAALRERVLDIGASQISAGSKTDPGGYADGVRRRESEQFTVDDTRPLEAIVRTVIGRGHLPSLCTSCYRSRRTGSAFTGMAADGRIKDFCLPNAILSLAEYAVAVEDEDLRELCLAAVRRARDTMNESSLAAEVDRRLEAVLAGERDLHF